MHLKVLRFLQIKRVLKLTIFFQHGNLLQSLWLLISSFPSLIFQSVSAYSPIVNPINCPWGQKAFTNYLGSNKADWEVISKKFSEITAKL